MQCWGMTSSAALTFEHSSVQCSAVQRAAEDQKQLVVECCFFLLSMQTAQKKSSIYKDFKAFDI